MRVLEKGYTAVLATLIIGAVGLGATLSVLTLGIASQQNTLASRWSAQAKAVTDACAEEGLLQIQSNSSFTGTNNITIAGVTCSYTVATTGASTRTVTSTASAGSVVRKNIVYVTIGASSISITSWQEVTS